MSTLQMMVANTAISVLFGHFWGGTIWPWLKAKIKARL
jgi:hypothetical protein